MPALEPLKKRRKPSEGDDTDDDTDDNTADSPLPTYSKVNDLTASISEHCDTLLSWLANAKQPRGKIDLAKRLIKCAMHIIPSLTRTWPCLQLRVNLISWITFAIILSLSVRLPILPRIISQQNSQPTPPALVPPSKKISKQRQAFRLFP